MTLSVPCLIRAIGKVESQLVEATAVGAFLAVHQWTDTDEGEYLDCWVVTHVPTGLRVAHSGLTNRFRTQAAAMKLAEELKEEDWDWDKPEKAPRKTKDAVRDALQKRQMRGRKYANS